MIYETLQASQPTLSPETSALPASPSPAFTATPLPSATVEIVGTTVSPTVISPAPKTATSTPTPEVPIADIQIFKPGDQSKIASPLSISANLKPGAKGRVSLELYGEDGRLLVRQIKAFDTPPGARVNLLADLEYGISAAAEAGRLVILVLDDAGRPSALNSVDLILLSLGEADVNPASAVNQAIIIEQPRAKSLVQGGTVLATGKALITPGEPLFIQILDGNGKVVGQRVGTVEGSDANGYGTFRVEVPYAVSQFTPVRLVAFTNGEPVSDIRQLSSTEFNLSP